MKTLKVISRSVSFVVFLGFTLSVLGCIAAVPIAIKYYKDENQTKAQAEMPAPAEKVYQTAVSMAEEKDVKILKKEDEKMYLEVTDGVQTASFKAEAGGDQKTVITVISAVTSEGTKETKETKEEKKTQEKELALRIIDRVCERLEVKCTIVKQ